VKACSLASGFINKKVRIKSAANAKTMVIFLGTVAFSSVEYLC
jgi:hypothetical protein